MPPRPPKVSAEVAGAGPKVEGRSFWRAHAVVLVGVAVVAAGGLAAGVTIATRRPARPSAALNSAARKAHRATAKVPLELLSLKPSQGSKNVGFDPTITLSFSEPLAPRSPLPTLFPPIQGTWSRPSATSLSFRPNGQLSPLERVAVELPAGASGVRSSSGALLAGPIKSSFTVVDAPTLRLQQLLSELGYLPVAFDRASSPTTGTRSGTESAPSTGNAQSAVQTLDAEPTVPSEIALEPEPGSFVWRYSAIPSQLASLWSPSNASVVTQGAVMAFEADHGLDVDGEAGPKVWKDLLAAVAGRQANPRPYDYLMVSETDPETLYVWSGGHVVYQTPTNTGISVAPTPLGTWPVYLRFTSVTMKGQNPDGSYYDDPGVPWVSYFHVGDAVHGFIRASYGFPQSLGCVELPPANAAAVFNYDTYGTLVTVTTGNLSAELDAAPAGRA